MNRKRIADPPVSPPELACRLAELFDEHGISYAVGGSLALGFHAEPRGTIDVDMNVFIAVDRELDRLLAVLQTVGFVPDGPVSTIRRQAREDAQFRGYIGGVRLDVFVPSIAYYAELSERRRRVVLAGRPIWILGPEDLVVLKMMFLRFKDLADVEAMARNMGDSLDRDFVCRKLAELAGADDGRIDQFLAILEDATRNRTQ